jgi:proteasome lid subunit RPN8/RPN11
MSDKPDISAIKPGECRQREFPAAGARPAGGDLRVSIGRRAYDQIRSHTAEDTEHEVCGVLLGELCRDGAGPWLHVTEVIRGEHTASQGAQVTITHDTWNHFHKVKDSRFPDLKYLGWYHSHPDFGVFLSAMDLFIHENFFSAPHQVALVVDPQRGEEGLFCWREGSAERAASFWVGSDHHRYEAAPEPSAERVALRELEKKIERLRFSLAGLGESVRAGPEGGWTQTALLVGILAFLAFLSWTTVKMDRKVSRQKLVEVEDAFRRKLLRVQLEPAKEQVELEYIMLPRQFEVERRTDPFSGESRVTYRLNLREIAEKLMLEMKQRGEAADDTKSGSGEAGPRSGSGSGSGDRPGSSLSPSAPGGRQGQGGGKPGE